MIRKLVTALFCDVADSTALAEQLDPETFLNILARYFEAISATIERHGGTVQKYAGDSVLAVFGVPVTHEDDALRAVRAAVEIRDQLPDLARGPGIPLRFRTGINTGLAMVDDGRFLAIGDAINLAARLEQAADPGEIVLGAGTLALVRDAVSTEPLEPMALKGKSVPVQAFRLLSLDPTAPGRARQLGAPLVGRKGELELARSIWERAVESARCHMVTILGPAGVGKSRLAGELVGLAGESAAVLSGRCLHYGEGITFWPLIEAFGGHAITERLEQGGAATAEELFWEVRHVLESLARERPVILQVDDLQWAEPMLLDLLEHVVELSHDAAIMVLCTARLELLEDRPGWGEGSPNVTTLLLEPLATAECEELLDQLGGGLEPQTRARVISASDGNPLFLEEIVELARERGVVEIPENIQALLTARLERLIPGERELLERGSIEGHVFHRDAVRALVSPRAVTDLPFHLTHLVSMDLIRPHPAEMYSDEAFRFRHLLIRDTAYERLPKAVRAELHERFAGWLEATVQDLPELDEIVGWHLEQAVRYRGEVELEVVPRLSQRAAEHLWSAGLRAGRRSDVAAARNLLERAHALADVSSDLAAGVGVDLAERLIEAGELGRADDLLQQAEREPDESGPASLSRLEWLLEARPSDAMRAIESRLDGLLAELGRAGDERGLARARWLAFMAHWAACRAAPAAEQAWRAADHARAAGDLGLASRTLGWYVATLIYGPANASTIAAELDAIEAQQPGPYLAGCVALGRAEVERLGGRFDGARRWVRNADATFEELGMDSMSARCAQALAQIELSADDPHAAVDVLQRSDEILERLGVDSARSTTLAQLAQAYQRIGALDQARAALEAAEEVGGPADKVNLIAANRVRSQIAERLGDHATARDTAARAVELAATTDFVTEQAAAGLALASALGAAGEPTLALTQAQAALELFAGKGDEPGAALARAVIRTLSGG